MASIEGLLQTIAESPDEHVATAHPLGFVHLLLWKHSSGSSLRLHLWPLEPFHPQFPIWPVHQHGWGLTSLVVRGEIRDMRYAVTQNAAGDRNIYEASYEGEMSVLRATDQKVRCKMEESSICGPGSVYHLGPDAYHASEATKSSVTLVRSGPPTGQPPRVVGSGQPKEVAFERYRLKAADLIQVLAEVAGPG